MKRTLKILAVVVVIFVLLFPLLIDPITTTYNITANTEQLIITTKDGDGSRLPLYGVNIYTDTSRYLENFDGVFEISRDVEITIDRIASGPVIITFESKGNAPTGFLYRSTDSKYFKETGPYLRIEINDINKRADEGQTTILPINGLVSIGRPIGFEVFGSSTALLRSGEIAMTGSSTFSKMTFDAGQKALNLGDQVIFEEQANKAIGFATINENPGMQVAYRVIAKTAKILKPGPREEGKGLEVKATILDRLLRASLLQFVSLCIGVGITLFSFAFEVNSHRKTLKAFFQ